jgi:hypothetical protein
MVIRVLAYVWAGLCLLAADELWEPREGIEDEGIDGGESGGLWYWGCSLRA